MKTKLAIHLLGLMAIFFSGHLAVAASPGQPYLAVVRMERPDRPLVRNRPAANGHRQLVAGIQAPFAQKYQTTEFDLPKNSILRLCAVVQGDPFKLLDLGGIEDRASGQLVWMMSRLATAPAPDSKKLRQVDRILPLKTGSYRLHFKIGTAEMQNGLHPVRPGNEKRGIWLFDETASHARGWGEFWEQAPNPEALGWSSEKLDRLIPVMGKVGTDALMVITNGKVVFEHGNTTGIIRSHSTRKSLLSALYGIYAANGQIDTSKTLDQLGITESLPLTKKEKQASILDLLKARSGVYIPAAAEAPAMRKARPKRGRHLPGSFWYYNNWDFNVLGTIFRQQTGQDIYRAFQRDIAEPIGMQDFMVERQAYQYEKEYSRHPAYPFLISARDMAKFGQLFLQKGWWQGKQIIPEDWIAASTTAYSQTNQQGVGYGYMWWVKTHATSAVTKGSYFASGYGGQKLYVVPAIDTVVVHRINIEVPGTVLTVAALAPDALMTRILQAYSGRKSDPLKKTPPRNTAPNAKRRLLDTHGRSANYSGNAFHGFRMALWACGFVFIGIPMIWAMIYLIQKALLKKPSSEDPNRTMARYGDPIKWIVAIAGLICSIYVWVLLTTPYALEYVSMVGMPDGLQWHERILLQTPKLGVLLTIFLLLATIRLWARRYGTWAERAYFAIITAAAVVFTFLAGHLNLIML